MSTVLCVTDDRYPVEWDSTKYRYVQIADHIEQQISNGDLQPGAALPAIGRLAEQYGVAQMTIIRATEELVTRGLVVVLRGRGTFVRRPDEPEG